MSWYGVVCRTRGLTLNVKTKVNRGPPKETRVLSNVLVCNTGSRKDREILKCDQQTYVKWSQFTSLREICPRVF